MGSRQNRDYEYIQVIWGIKIAKFLVEMELFPPNQTGGKEMFGSQLRNDSMLSLLTNPQCSEIQCMIINNTLS